MQRAFSLADAKLARELRTGLTDAAEPVRTDAERRAVAEISHIGDRWSRMRIGVTRSLVYVAPVERGVKTKGRQSLRRPNLAPLMMNKAMEPALDANEERVLHTIEGLLDNVGKAWER